MKNWLDFEKRFKELAPDLKNSRIDDQTGAAGEYWRVAGISANRESIQEFETLCMITGRELTNALKDKEQYSKIIDHEDPKIRWYRLLKMHSQSYHRDISGYQTEEDGSKGWIHGGSISNIGNGSANLCLWLEAKHPITMPWHERLYEDYGREIVIGIILIIISAIITA